MPVCPPVTEEDAHSGQRRGAVAFPLEGADAATTERAGIGLAGDRQQPLARISRSRADGGETERVTYISKNHVSPDRERERALQQFVVIDFQPL